MLIIIGIQSNHPSALTCRLPDKTSATLPRPLRPFPPPPRARFLRYRLSSPERRRHSPPPVPRSPLLTPTLTRIPPTSPPPQLVKGPECRNIGYLFWSCCTHVQGLLRRRSRDRSRPRRVETPALWKPEILGCLWKCCIQEAFVRGRGGGRGAGWWWLLLSTPTNISYKKTATAVLVGGAGVR